MRLTSRVEALEERFQPDEDVARWIRTAEAELGAGIARLEALGMDAAQEEAAAAVVRQWMSRNADPRLWPILNVRALADLLAVVPGGLRLPLLQALSREAVARERDHDYSNLPLLSWVEYLASGQSSLPPGLNETTVRTLLDVYLGHHDELQGSALTCEECGLQRPHRKWPKRYEDTATQPAEFFGDDCPHCGGTRSAWAHLRPATRGME